MKWTMNPKLGSESAAETPRSHPSLEGRRLNRFFPRHPSSCVVPCECPKMKRKHGEGGGDLPTLPDPVESSGQVSVGGKDGEVSSCDNLGEIHPAVQRPESSRTAKRIRSANKRELSVLQLQVAMISDDDGDRPIHVAVAHEDLKLVHRLCCLMLRAAVSLDLTNFLRQTPLHLAVMLGNADMVRMLLKFGASLLLKDRNGNSVLHLAVKTNTTKNVLCVLLSHPLAKNIINTLDHEGYSALHYAVFKNNSAAVECLHRCGADMDIVDGKSGRTGIIHSVLEQNLEMVNILLKCGASAVKMDYSSRSAFELALQSSNVQIIKLLEKHISPNDLSSSKSEPSVEVEPRAAVPDFVNVPERTRREISVSKTRKVANDLGCGRKNEVKQMFTSEKKESHRCS